MSGKVGFTAKSPKERAEDLSKATEVPLALAYVVVHSWHHQNARELEQAAHAALDDIRGALSANSLRHPLKRLGKE